MRNQGHLAVMAFWVDGNRVLGEPYDVVPIMKNVYQAFVLKDQGAVKECVGNKIDFS